jgi:hypothetical protein
MTGALAMVLRAAGRALRRGARPEDGSATLEFVIYFPLFFAVLASTIEAGIFMSRQVMLERAVDLSLRSLRLGTMENPSAATLRDAICEETVIVPDCRNVLLLELRRVSTATWDGLETPPSCVNRDEDIQPVTQFTPGTDNDLMMVRACVVVDPIIPTSGLAMALPRDASGGFRLLASSVFVNEPS